MRSVASFTCVEGVVYYRDCMLLFTNLIYRVVLLAPWHQTLEEMVVKLDMPLWWTQASYLDISQITLAIAGLEMLNVCYLNCFNGNLIHSTCSVGGTATGTTKYWRGTGEDTNFEGAMTKMRRIHTLLVRSNIDRAISSLDNVVVFRKWS